MSLGFKVEIERALDTLAAQGTDPAIALIARAKQKFENCLLAFQGYGEIPYTMYSPRTWYDANDDEGWIVSRKENLYVAMARSVSLGRGERPEYVEQFIHAIPLVWVVLGRLPVLLCLGRLLAGIFYRFVHEPPLNR